MRKSDSNVFEPSTRNVCGIHEGNTNSYLKHDRAIEDFLAEIEPNYPSAIAKLTEGQVDHETIYTVAGFVSAVHSCSPTGMRVHTPQLKEMLTTTTELLDEHGEFDKSPLPEALGEASLTDLLQSGKVQLEVDPKYPQAVCIAGVMNLVRVFGNSAWEILVNEFSNSPFLTSDYPIGIEIVGQLSVKLVPLSPTLAIRITPNIDALDESDQFDMQFGGFRWRNRMPSRKEVAHINRTIVRCAENLVFCSSRLDWFERFVRRNSMYQLSTQINRLQSPDGNGSYLFAGQRIVQKST